MTRWLVAAGGVAILMLGVSACSSSKLLGDNPNGTVSSTTKPTTTIVPTTAVAPTSTTTSTTTTSTTTTIAATTTVAPTPTAAPTSTTAAPTTAPTTTAPPQGAQGSQGQGANASGALPTVDLDPLDGDYMAVVKPSTIYLSGDASNIVTGINWIGWDAKGATGHGTVNIQGCVPDCAQGSETPTPVTIYLNDPVDGRFTLLTENVQGTSSQNFTVPTS